MIRVTRNEVADLQGLIKKWRTFQERQQGIAEAILTRVLGILDIPDRSKLLEEKGSSKEFYEVRLFVQTHVQELGLTDHPSDEELAHWIRTIGMSSLM